MKLHKDRGSHSLTGVVAVFLEFFISRSRSSFRLIFPDTVFWSEFTNSIARGYLYGAALIWFYKNRQKKSIPGYLQTGDFFKMPVAGDDLPVITEGNCRYHFIEIPDGIALYE